MNLKMPCRKKLERLVKLFSVFNIAKNGCIGPLCVGQSLQEFKSSTSGIIDLSSWFDEEFHRGGNIYSNYYNIHPIVEFYFHEDASELRLNFIELYIPDKEQIRHYYENRKCEFNEDVFNKVNFRIDYQGLYKGQKISECDEILSNCRIEKYRYKGTSYIEEEIVYKIDGYIALYFYQNELGGGRVLSPANSWWGMLRKEM